MSDTALNAEETKRQNRRTVIQLLRRAPLSRIALSRATGLTRAAITLITRELIDEGILVEGESFARMQKGKSPIPLNVVPTVCYAVGVFLNRSMCLIGLSDFCGHTVSQRKIQIQPQKGLSDLKQEIEALLAENRDKRILGIGISTPGPLDTERGVILNPPYFEDWQNTAIVPYLSSGLDIPVYLEKDASVLALYHLETGASRDFLLLFVENAVGSGIVSDGKLLVSSGHYTAELGHTSIQYNGKLCGCGNRGCLEAYASVPNLLRDAGSRYNSWEELIDAGDTALLEQEAEYLSAGIVNIRNLISIDTVYLAGSIRYGFDRLAPLLMQRISRMSMLKTSIEILPSYHTEDIGVAAAANIVFTKLLDTI